MIPFWCWNVSSMQWNLELCYSRRSTQSDQVLFFNSFFIEPINICSSQRGRFMKLNTLLSKGWEAKFPENPCGPDRTFHSFWALESADRRFWTLWESQIDGFWGSKIVNMFGRVSTSAYIEIVKVLSNKISEMNPDHYLTSDCLHMISQIYKLRDISWGLLSGQKYTAALPNVAQS